MISNRNETLLRQEFKRRYLTEFSHYVGGLMEESAGHSANFLFMFLTLFISGPLSVPVAQGFWDLACRRVMPRCKRASRKR